VREIQILDGPGRARDVARGDVHVQRDLRETAPIAVDDHRGHAAHGSGHGARLQVCGGLALGLQDARSRRAPESRQIHGQLVGGVQRPLVVGAGHDNAVGPAERRGNQGEQTLAFLQALQVDRATLQQTRDVQVAAADEHRQGNGRRLRNVGRPEHHRQRQGRRLEPEPAGDVRRRLDVLDRRLGRQDDSGRDAVGEAVAVRVTHGAAGDAINRREAARVD
jgi:hypothetical protein